MVTMKQVGLNVASDPLMSLNYLSVKGGMVVVVADDPGPISSQTEQDTRHFGEYAKIPVFDPSSPEEAYEMIQDAFSWSERFHRPVIFRPTTRICHACADIDTSGQRYQNRPEGFVKDSGKWVIFPPHCVSESLKAGGTEGNSVRRIFKLPLLIPLPARGGLASRREASSYQYAHGGAFLFACRYPLFPFEKSLPQLLFPEKLGLEFFKRRHRRAVPGRAGPGN